MTISIEAALANCGVTDHTLAQQQKNELDELGFTIFYDVIDAAWLTKLFWLRPIM